MKVTLYMPYYDYNDSAFDVNGDYYSDDEYIKAVSSEYNKNKDVIYNSMKDYTNGRGGLVQGSDGQTYKFGAKVSENEDKVAYSSCDAIIYDDGGNEDTVDGIISRFAARKPFVEMIEFGDETTEEEFMTEVTLWVKEHNSINKYKDYKGEEWAWVNEPKRSLRMHFKNKADEDVYAVLDDCKIMDIVDGRTMIVFVDKIRLGNNILVGSKNKKVE